MNPSDPITRRTFQTRLTLTAGALAAGPVALAAASADDERDYPAPKFQPRTDRPALGSTLVRDFVIFAHYDLDMVKQLLEKQPALLNATVDWGLGDFESALGGASHMGQRAIAEFLLSQGARIDVFAATMLGHLDVVQALLTAHPNLINAKGPHGIPLIAHAKAGKEQAAAVLAYLEARQRDEKNG